MPVINSYCQFVATLPANNVHKIYHDTQYGFSIASDDELFGRLILEINQAGLSWTTILNKQDAFRQAYDNFNIAIIANYTDAKVKELLNNPGIIRNRLKIAAAIHNAKQVLELQKQFGSFAHWLSAQGTLPKESWVKLFKKHFKFVGGEIVNEFLVSSGYLPGAHQKTCPIAKCLKLAQK